MSSITSMVHGIKTREPALLGGPSCVFTNLSQSLNETGGFFNPKALSSRLLVAEVRSNWNLVYNKIIDGNKLQICHYTSLTLRGKIRTRSSRGCLLKYAKFLSILQRHIDKEELVS